MISELRRERLAGVPGRALALAATALGAGREVEHALPGEVLDPAAAEDVVLARVLEVDLLAARLHRRQRAQRLREALGRDVDRRGEDVQVLAVGDDHREGEHDADVQQQPDALDHLERTVRDAAEQVADADRGPGPGLVRERAQCRGRAAEQEHRPQHVEDHEEDQPGAAGVRAVEPRVARLALRGVPEPDHREHAERDQREHRDRVLQEPEHRPAADQRDVEVRHEQRAVGLEVDRDQDHERPEREEVRQAGHRPLQQLALAEHLDELCPDALVQPVGAVVRRLSGSDQLVDPEGAPARDRQGDHGQSQTDHQPPHHRVPPRTSLRVVVGTRRQSAEKGSARPHGAPSLFTAGSCVLPNSSALDSDSSPGGGQSRVPAQVGHGSRVTPASHGGSAVRVRTIAVRASDGPTAGPLLYYPAGRHGLLGPIGAAISERSLRIVVRAEEEP